MGGSTAACPTRLKKKDKRASKFFKVGTHRSRVPWAVKIQREEEQEEWGKKVGFEIRVLSMISMVFCC